MPRVRILTNCVVAGTVHAAGNVIDASDVDTDTLLFLRRGTLSDVPQEPAAGDQSGQGEE